jgi:protein-S-isoprenylcysteine O-methyltransferase Ste14
MGRRVVIALFAVMAATVVVETCRALGDAATGHGTRPWLDFGYSALKAGLIGAFTVFVVRRGPARRPVRRPIAFVACTAAMLSVVLLERPPVSTATPLVVAGESLALIAGAWMIVATVALGRCFGVLPEARGLITHGPYRFVRHPLYLGEFNLCAALILASPSTRNAVLAVVFAVAQSLRMDMEERELTDQFPEYRDYARRTRRLIPIPIPRDESGAA